MIAAAGSGQRLGAGGPKAFVELGGTPLLARAAAAAAEATTIEGVVIVAPPGEEREAERIIDAAGIAAVGLVAGGETRAESVRAGLAAVEGELALIHDAARPLAPPELFDAIVRRLSAGDAEAAIAAAPVLDTVKRSRDQHAGGAADGGEVEATVPRERLWLAQTPQGFRVAALRAAQAEAERRDDFEAATDEASLIEAAGGRVLIEPAPHGNIKVTSRADLALAEAILAAR